MVVGGRVHTGSFDREMSKCVSVSVCYCLALGGQGADVISVYFVCLMHCLASHAGRWAGTVASEPGGSEGWCVGVDGLLHHLSVWYKYSHWEQK